MWEGRGADVINFASVDRHEVHTDMGPVPYVRLGAEVQQIVVRCEDLGGVVGLGVKEEVPATGVHFIVTPGDTMSSEFDYSQLN